MAIAKVPSAPAPGQIAMVCFNRIPQDNPSFKYQRLGPMALTNQQQYAARHGYVFYGDAPPSTGSPACWEKIPAILQALRSHEWVLWADSDALVASPERRLEDFCDPAYDLVMQCPGDYFQRIGVNAAAGLAAMPVNSGVFMVQATSWAKEFLQTAYALKPASTCSGFWDGIGEQEAMAKLLKGKPQDLARIRYVDGMQSHPALLGSGKLFVHFYGNQASHLIPTEQVDAILQRWENAVRSDGPLPADVARFHWCCIQNKQAATAIDRGGPERFLYGSNEILLGP